jgi:type IV pilus assembly protein PilO
MPDLRQTRKKIKMTLGVLLAIDVLAVGVYFSPLIGSSDSRRQELNQLWGELQTKTKQVEPLKNLDQKVVLANQQIADFYKKRLPSEDSQIAAQLGKLAAANGVTIEAARYKVDPVEVGKLEPVEMEAQLTGNYVSLAKFINALERDEIFFIIDGVSLAGEQKGPIKLQMKFETYLKAGRSEAGA